MQFCAPIWAARGDEVAGQLHSKLTGQLFFINFHIDSGVCPGVFVLVFFVRFKSPVEFVRENQTGPGLSKLFFRGPKASKESRGPDETRNPKGDQFRIFLGVIASALTL